MITLQKVGAATGIAAPVIAFACILSAILSYSPFSWTTNALSDLGVVEGVTMVVFNSGLVAAGVLGFIFAVLGLYGYFKKSVAGRVGSVFFAGACAALVCIGVFNEHFSPTHYIVSVLFFSLAPIALFTLTIAFYRGRNRNLAAFSVLIGIAAAIPWILQFTLYYVPNVAIPEIISAILVGAWAVTVSVKILQTRAANLSRQSIS